MMEDRPDETKPPPGESGDSEDRDLSQLFQRTASEVPRFDPAGLLQGELDIKAGETTFGSSGTDRWGDYTGMTIDPDGTTFWYLGEYAKDNGNARNWGTYIGALEFADCLDNEIFSDGFESGDTSAWSSQQP